MSLASEAARNQFKSDIFFTGGNTGIQPVSRPVRENLKSNVFNSDNVAAGTPSAKNAKDHLRSDIFNTSGPKESFHKHTVSNATKSNIVLGNAEPVIVKKDKTKVVHNPDPYFKQETAFTRKLKEFYPEDFEKYKNLAESGKITRGTIEKETTIFNENRMKELSNPNLTAKERRILSNMVDLNQEDAKYSAQSTKNQNINDEKKVFDKNALENKMKEMKSNIFYDPQKETVYQNFKPSKKQPKEDEEKKPEPVRATKIPKSNWNSKLDWNDAKNEILFHNEDNNKNYSAFERKIKNLQGNMADPKSNPNAENKFEPVPNPIEENRHEKKDRNTINDTLKEAVGNDEHRLKKNMELSAVHQGSDFYKNNAKFMKNIDRQVKSYEIKDIHNFENLKVDEIESIFRKKGIHIYDVKPSGSLIGNTAGEISFKVRETDDDAKFSKNFEDVTKRLQNDLKLNVEPTKVKDKKKMTEALPANLKWDTPGSSNFGDKQADKQKIENGPKKEKFSKTYVPINTTFKNFHGLHGFSMK